MNILLVYLLLINASGIVLMLADKQAAINNRRRIPEKDLLGTAFLGGSAGIYLGMRIARHKTRHKKFSIGVPILLAVHILAFLLLTQVIPLKSFYMEIFPK